MKRIELVGPPGVGKTTFKKALCQKARKLKINAVEQEALPLLFLAEERYPKLAQLLTQLPYRILRFAPYYTPYIVYQHFRTFNAFKPPKDTDVWNELSRYHLNILLKSKPDRTPLGFCNLLSDALASARYATVSNLDCVAVLDEGVCQKNLRIAMHKNKTGPDMLHFGDPKTTLVIVLNTSSEVIIRRIEKRDGYNRNNRQRILTAIENTKHLSCAHVKNQARITQIDASLPVKSQLDQALPAIMKVCL